MGIYQDRTHSELQNAKDSDHIKYTSYIRNEMKGNQKSLREGLVWEITKDLENK
jgi:hypothetical protein